MAAIFLTPLTFNSNRRGGSKYYSCYIEPSFFFNCIYRGGSNILATIYWPPFYYYWRGGSIFNGIDILNPLLFLINTGVQNIKIPIEEGRSKYGCNKLTQISNFNWRGGQKYNGYENLNPLLLPIPIVELVSK